MKYIDIKLGYSKEEIIEVSNVIKAGGIVILPTDTVYGLACDVMNEEAIKKIYDLKGRSFSNPMNILVSNIDMIRKVTKRISKKEEEIIERFFPGPLSIIFKKNEVVPNIVTAGLDTIGIRMPENDFLLELIENLEMPIVATSCNFAGEAPMTNTIGIFKKFVEQVDCIVDSGEAKIGVASTVIKVERNDVKILRDGPIKKSELIKNS